MNIEVGMDMPTEMLSEGTATVTPSSKQLTLADQLWNRTADKPRKDSQDLFLQLLRENDYDDPQGFKFYDLFNQNERLEYFNPFCEENNNEAAEKGISQAQMQHQEAIQIEVDNQANFHQQQPQQLAIIQQHQQQQQQQQRSQLQLPHLLSQQQQQQLEQTKPTMSQLEPPSTQSIAEEIAQQQQLMDSALDKVPMLSQISQNSDIKCTSADKMLDEGNSSNNNNININNSGNNSNDVVYTGCNCKKSRCLKLYCECFANQGFCGEGCNCTECGNKMNNDEEREKAIQEALSRNPEAFQFKLVEQKPKNKGCSCKKTHCKKKYCECYGSGNVCSSSCKCEGCQNLKEEDRQSNYTVSTQETPSFTEILEEKTKSSKKKIRANSCKKLTAEDITLTSLKNDNSLNLQSYSTFKEISIKTQVSPFSILDEQQPQQQKLSQQQIQQQQLLFKD